MANIYEEALKLHEELKGKLSTELKTPLEDKETLSLVYSPGVAEPCRKIKEDPKLSYTYTWKGNVVGVISDGTAVLGLGDIGPQAALPVMEGKCVLFKRFGGVNAVPIVVDTKDTEEIIDFVKKIAPSFGGINLEDISAPRCVEIERRLKEELNIPVFHDDQHGTAIVVTAGLINSLKLVGKKPSECTATVSGVGAAGSSIIRMIKKLGIKNIYGFNSKGILNRNKNEQNPLYSELAEITNLDCEDLNLNEAMKKSDIFIGVSIAGIINADMVRSMKRDPIIFAMANPEPEIPYDEARRAGAKVVGTGRSDYPNQVNNVLAFPGIFKGALKVGAKKITEEMKFAASEALAGLLLDDEIIEEYVIPSPFDSRVPDAVAEAVAKCAIKEGVVR